MNLYLCYQNIREYSQFRYQPVRVSSHKGHGAPQQCGAFVLLLPQDADQIFINIKHLFTILPGCKYPGAC